MKPTIEEQNADIHHNPMNLRSVLNFWASDPSCYESNDKETNHSFKRAKYFASMALEFEKEILRRDAEIRYLKQRQSNDVVLNEIAKDRDAFRAENEHFKERIVALTADIANALNGQDKLLKKLDERGELERRNIELNRRIDVLKDDRLTREQELEVLRLKSQAQDDANKALLDEIENIRKSIGLIRAIASLDEKMDRAITEALNLLS